MRWATLPASSLCVRAGSIAVTRTPRVFGAGLGGHDGPRHVGTDPRDTVVGHDIWLGYSTLVLPGVTIGHGAVVAAASVVAREVPAYAMVWLAIRRASSARGSRRRM
jgi:acetyltransferase-like isoleucine patch superfamily enzyme